MAEQLSHVLLFVNFGVIAGLLGPMLWQWWQRPTALAAAAHGWRGWMLTALGLLALTWSVRDAYSARRLGRQALARPPPAAEPAA